MHVLYILLSNGLLATTSQIQQPTPIFKLWLPVYTCQIKLSWNIFEIISVFHFTCNHAPTEIFSKLSEKLKELWNYFENISATLNMMENIHELQYASEIIFEIISDKFPRAEIMWFFSFRWTSTKAEIIWNNNFMSHVTTPLTPSTPAVPNYCCSKGSAPYWSNPPFLIFDIRALWRSVLSARAPECQKLKTVG